MFTMMIIEDIIKIYRVRFKDKTILQYLVLLLGLDNKCEWKILGTCFILFTAQNQTDLLQLLQFSLLKVLSCF